jgi:hypothetical protein
MRHARPEASPKKPRELTKSQGLAIEQANRLLVDLAQQKEISLSASNDGSAAADMLRRCLPKIDPERRNHVVLLDGARGSGKTTAMLTLLKTYRHRVVEREWPKDGAWAPSTEEQSQAPIVPLDVIDLQWLNEEASLPIAVMAALRQLAHAIDDGLLEAECSPDKLGKPTENQDKPDMGKLWQEMVAAISTWMGQASHRRAQLDAESFANLLSKEAQDFQEVFRQFVDALCRYYCKLFNITENHLPLFVVAVDDADMNPRRAAKVLRLLRVLYHSRLVFLITGDSSLFMQSLEREFHRSLYGDLGSASSNASSLGPQGTSD